MKRLVYAALPLIFLIIFTGCQTPNLKGKGEEGVDKFSGMYVSENASMDIYLDDNDEYVGEISIGNDDSTIYYFKFTSVSDKNKLSYKNGELTKLTYDEYGDFTEETIKEKTKGSVKRRGDELIWKDSSQKESYSFVAGL